MSEILSLAVDRDAAIARASGVLRAGELVVLPTDTVYGLAADAFNREATARVFAAKRRPRALPLPVLVSRPRQAWALCANVPPNAVELAGAFWPGPITLILPQGPDLEWDLGDARGVLAVRMPAHDDLIALLEVVGPLAVTSANLSGEPTPRTVEEIRARLGDQVALYLDGGPSAMEGGSTIVDLTGSEPLIVREGPIPAADIERVLGAAVARGTS